MKTVNVQKLSQDGLVQLFKWIDKNQVKFKGVVLICHGMGEHIERYEGFAEKLTASGYIVYGHNQRGHKGSISSKDNYGYMSDKDNFEILVSDLYEIMELVKKEYPKLPLFIFGHSMGSFVTQRFIQLYGNKVEGIILSGSAKQPNGILTFGIVVSTIISRFKGRRHRSKFLNKISFEAYNNKFKPNRTEFDWLNRDEKEVDKYIEDEYCGGIFTVAYFNDFFKGLRRINQNFELVPKDLPIFIISGSNDPVGGSSKLTNTLYKKFKSLKIKDLEIKLYEGARHEILLEINKDEVMTDAINWLDKHI